MALELERQRQRITTVKAKARMLCLCAACASYFHHSSLQGLVTDRDISCQSGKNYCDRNNLEEHVSIAGWMLLLIRVHSPRSSTES